LTGSVNFVAPHLTPAGARRRISPICRTRRSSPGPARFSPARGEKTALLPVDPAAYHKTVDVLRLAETFVDACFSGTASDGLCRVHNRIALGVGHTLSKRRAERRRTLQASSQWA
jgi:hypothetical protein